MLSMSVHPAVDQLCKRVLVPQNNECLILLLAHDMQTGKGVLAQNPTSASMVKYGTAANSLTQNATGSSEVTPLLHSITILKHVASLSNHSNSCS